MIGTMFGSLDQGRRIMASSWIGTGVFTVLAVLATAVLGPVRYVAVGGDLVLFVVGVVVFFWAYAVAVGRSREVEIGIGGLFFLAGPGTAPGRVKWHLNGSFAAQVVVAVATASARPFTTLAFGILVPLHALAHTGLWAARYGHFGPRTTPSGPRIEQNAGHG
ncbi:MAG: hypothetical protein QOD72_53 [Acidimicrobiaceae bacterium]|jgi:hypothetical protein|nr:hypothetical protein [Acidimicrobiaceae bacterium]